MAHVAVRQLKTLTAATTGANAATIPIGGLEDAASVTIWMVSTGAYASTGNGLSLQVSQFDPSITSSAAEVGVIVSTFYSNLSSTIFSSGAGLITSSGYSITISPISFRGMRIAGLTSATQGENVAFVSKQISV